ncbi:hypothetical protein Patl1_34066 [Pistacia atlantica]|uniref:Uncharacterized protein n=1 Tax=Pistacia atlantica TaxID=434234 RepID=A0ACC0ZVQ5_9ROSI|nr:hypothetical protein Patl1_34066 [Pistacia atlantica]
MASKAFRGNCQQIYNLTSNETVQNTLELCPNSTKRENKNGFDPLCRLYHRIFLEITRLILRLDPNHALQYNYKLHSEFQSMKIYC